MKIATINNIACAMILLALLAACTRTNDSDQSEEQENDSAVVTLTPSQFKLSGVAVETMPYYTFTGSLNVNGQLKTEPQDRAEVSAPMGANVKRILVTEGQRVSRGQVLALLSHADLIDMQRRLVQAKEKLVYLGEEYERQKTLYSHKVNAGKDYQQVASEYRAMQAEVRTTARQLQLLGISPQAAVRGQLVTEIAVRSPIDGTVEHVAAALGQYADPTAKLFSIVNNNRLYADVLVYERDLGKLRVGQKAKVTIGDTRLAGSVKSIGGILDDSSKAVHARIAIDGNKSGLVAGMYVRASIVTVTRKSPAVPDDGIATDESRSFVFIYKPGKGKKIFVPRVVRTGRKENGMTEILSGLNQGELVVVQGAYTLMSEWKKHEVGEE